MSDITRDYSFGGFLHHYRIAQKLTLRKMCLMIKMDSGNYSRMERSLLPPPTTVSKVIRLLKPLKLSKEQQEFMCAMALEAVLAKAKEDFNR